LEARADVANVRHIGTIAALDVRDVGRGYLSGVAPKLYRYFVAQGVLLRPIGPTIYMLPPYCVSQKDLDVIVSTIERALDALRDGQLERAA
jgi:adenosylmethionine-8-amino-7-oxononanoate aminotransferase